MLAFLLGAQFMIVLDISIVNISLPSIQQTFGLSVAALQGIVTAYALAFGGLLLLGGRAADLYGRKRVFLFGTAGFTTLSFLVGFTPAASFLIPLRAAQGLFAAFMSPSLLSIILVTFRDTADRTLALSFRSAVSASGSTFGLLFGGIIAQFLTWRWNFFVNVPFGILVFIAAWKLVPPHEAEDPNKSLDLPGAVLATGAVMLLVYAFALASQRGFTAPLTLASFSASAVLLALFVVNERRAVHPLVPFSVFMVGNVALADGIRVALSSGFFALFFFMSLYVQNVLGYSPLDSGLAFLPISLTTALTAINAPRLMRRFGYKVMLFFGPLFLATGLFMFTRIGLHDTYLTLLPWFLLSGFGVGLSFFATVMAGTSGVPAHESGLASGLISTAQQLGGSVGLSVCTAAEAAGIAAATARGLHGTARMLVGFHYAFFVAAGFALFGALLALFLKPAPLAR